LFFRAKRSLRHQLACKGFKAKEHLLPALSLFAALTAGRSKAASAATGIKAASLHVSTATAALGVATTKAGVAAIVTVAACVIAGTAGRVTMTSEGDAPRAVIEPAKNLDTTLLDRLQSPDFLRPSAIGKVPVPAGQENILDGTGFPWVDRATQKPAQPGADLRELLLDKPLLDRRAVILAADLRIDVQFQRPIVDGPGADIVVAGWASPSPKIEVLDAEGRAILLPNPTQLRDTWDRTIWGYDLAQLRLPIAVRVVRITGIHNQGPHQGFELSEIRARMAQSEAQLRF